MFYTLIGKNKRLDRFVLHYMKCHIMKIIQVKIFLNYF